MSSRWCGNKDFWDLEMNWVRRKGICNAQFVEMWSRPFKTFAKKHIWHWTQLLKDPNGQTFHLLGAIIVRAWNLVRTNAISTLIMSLHWQPTVEIAVRIVRVCFDRFHYKVGEGYKIFCSWNLAPVILGRLRKVLPSKNQPFEEFLSL